MLMGDFRFTRRKNQHAQRELAHTWTPDLH
jgi:hypothetical protein